MIFQLKLLIIFAYKKTEEIETKLDVKRELAMDNLRPKTSRVKIRCKLRKPNFTNFYFIYKSYEI